MLDTKRRIFLQESLATSAVATAWAAGLIAPQALLAEWPKSVFDTKDLPAVLKGMYGTDVTETNDAVQIKVPEIAENGAVVPITVESTLPGITQIALFSSVNPYPLAADFHFTENMVPYISTRIKMSKSGEVVAVVKAGDKLFSSRKEVKVTIGGCGG